jgi:transmembrane sensor
VRDGWSPARARRVLERTERALERRRAAVRGSFVVAAAAALVLLASSQRERLWPSAPAAVAAASATPRNLLTLQDGSAVELQGDDTVVETVETTPASTDMRVVRGSATFRVTHAPSRTFRVHAGSLVAEVIGTEFTVTREPSGASVTVVSGSVRVLHGGEQSLLSKGGTIRVDDPAAEAAPSASTSSNAAPPKTPAPAAWRELAREADYERAYRSLQHAGRSDVRDEPDDLLLAADVARLSKHPAEAIPHLRAVVTRHARDPRAPLAAFTLGRVLLESLGRPQEAAAAFRTAQDLAPSGLLVEDALAREVEALSRAGESSAARARAELYVRRYPQGRKLGSVRRHGGLD